MNIEQILIAEGHYLRLLRRDRWEYVERKGITGIVGIVAVTNEEKLLLVEQYRPPVSARVIELPAGLAGDVPGTESESLAIAARRELLEETGYEAAQMTFLAEGPPSSGMSTEIITLFHAAGLRKKEEGGGDHTEEIVVHEVPVTEVYAWLDERRRHGILIDLRIYTALYFVMTGSSNK